MTNIIFTDVTGTDIEIVPEEQSHIILNLSSEQRQFTKIFAHTIKAPHEIYKLWRRDPIDQDRWILIRAYLQILDLSETEIAEPYVISVVEFVWEKRWKIYSMEMMLGDPAETTEKINNTVRFGERLFCHI
jgi:hypothetical protein